MLWLALVFPDLAIESQPELAQATTSWALTGHDRVLECNQAARDRGIRTGSSLTAAFALDPELQHQAYSAETEARALLALAEWALGYAGEVSLEGSHALLLEVGSTRRYFGGLPALLSRITATIAQRHHRCAWAVAPTPLAALWLARGAPGQCVEETARLSESLAGLPLWVSDFSPQQQAGLRGVGIDTLGDCFRLAAADLAHRYGPEIPQAFARALGQTPDPRRYFLPETRFACRIELPCPELESGRLMLGLDRLVPKVADWALRRAQMLTRIALLLEHEGQPESRLVIGFAGSRKTTHLQLVIRERLQQFRLDHPVCAIRLEVLAAESFTETSIGLLPTPPSRLNEGQELLERLRARLGNEAVHGLALCADHRPERAWSFAEPGIRRMSRDAQGPANHRPDSPRPLWLLETPRDLGGAQLPWLGRPMRLLAGPERIESGWWDGADVARDYYVAAGADGPQYWVFRDCRQQGRWFLQGVFG